MRLHAFMVAAALLAAAPLVHAESRPPAAAASPAPAAVTGHVNINTADAATLAEGLNGVGQKKAEAIVAYRKAHGPFTSLEQLQEVKGIGPGIIAKNKNVIVFH